MGGTEAYAPPEFEERDSRPNRKYDVWSLGCVFLEICTFIVLGYDGIRELDTLKFSKSADGHCEYESFYEEDKSANSHRLKQTISKWIKEMPYSRTVQNEEGRLFLIEILKLVTGMLEIEVSKRLTSEEVYNELRRILHPYLFDHPSTPNQDIERVTIPPNELELGPETTSTIHGLVCSIGNDQFKGPIRISENEEKDIRIFNISEGQLKIRNMGNKTSLFLTPQYAFTHENHPAYSGSHMILGSAEGDLAQPPLSLRINFRDIRKAAVLQSVILNQEVKRSLRLNSIEIRRDPRFFNKLLGRKQRRPTENIRGGHVQLWLASPAEPINQIQDTRLRRRSTRGSQSAADSLAARRRIVIFCSNEIYTVSFSKAVRLAPREPREASLALHIVLTDRQVTPSFTVSTITSGSKDTAPSIPVDRTRFELLESKSASCFQCQSIILTFQCLADVDLFEHAYKSMKEAWRMENALFEGASRGMA